MAVVLM